MTPSKLLPRLKKKPRKPPSGHKKSLKNKKPKMQKKLQKLSNWHSKSGLALRSSKKKKNKLYKRQRLCKNWPVMKGLAKIDMEPAALTMLLCGIDLKEGRKKAWYER